MCSLCVTLQCYSLLGHSGLKQTESIKAFYPSEGERLIPEGQSRDVEYCIQIEFLILPSSLSAPMGVFPF